MRSRRVKIFVYQFQIKNIQFFLILGLKILVVQLLELHLQGVCRAHKCVLSEPIHPQIYTNKASLADDEMCAFILHELNTLVISSLV